MSGLRVLVFVSIVACVYAQGISALKYTTHPDGLACNTLSEDSISASNNCDGGFEKTMTAGTNDGHNIIPQQGDASLTVLKFEGPLASGSFLSLVDTSHSPGQPCAPVEGGHVADNTHSGPMKSTHNGDPSSATPGKVVRLMQNSPGVLLATDKVFAVCYATGAGDTSDSTWSSSNITVRISKIRELKIYDQVYRSCPDDQPCVLPNHPALKVHYAGGLADHRYISFVDSTLFAGKPCDSGAYAADFKDYQHSGSLTSTGNTFTIDTAGLSAVKTFTVCYAESGGLTTSIWTDSGLRVKRSALTSVAYGVEVGRVGDGVSYSAWNRNDNDNDLIPTDRLPRAARNTLIRYTGELVANARVSLVRNTLGRGQPCRYPQIASARNGLSSDSNHTSVEQASNREVVLRNLHSLDLYDGGTAQLHVYAVCYSADGVSWADSYVRYSLSELESLQHHSAIHVTSGVVPYEDDIEFVAEGVQNNTLIAFSMDQLGTNVVNNPNNVQRYNPCASAGVSQSVNYQEGTGGSTDPGGNTRIAFNTTSLDTGTIVASPYTGRDVFVSNNEAIAGGVRPQHSFAVCYKLNGLSNWFDSGLRLTISKLSAISHGKTGAAYAPFTFIPGNAGYELPLTGQAHSRQVIPTVRNQQITYFSSPTSGTALGSTRTLSLVDASLNSGKPCLLGANAGADEDAQHTGAVTAQGSVVTFPQSIQLDDTKTFAVCYSVTTGWTADTTWTDSYIRLRVSAVEGVTSLGVTHRVNNYVATIASREATSVYDAFYYKGQSQSYLPMTYSGTLTPQRYLSLVDDTLNSGFPCANDGIASSQAGGEGLSAVQAGTLNADNQKTVLFTTAGLNSTRTYAICYSSTGASSGFQDSGIRVKRSVVTSIQYSSGYAYPAAREMTSVEYDTNRIPAVPAATWENDITLSYVGSAETSAITLSFRRSDQLNNDPCADTSQPSATAVSTGAVNVSATGKLGAITNANLLTHGARFSLCYKLGNSEWADSYIRVTTTGLAALEHYVGRYTDATLTPGRLLRHRTAGHLPASEPMLLCGGRNCDQLAYNGTLAPNQAVSFVATRQPGVTHTEHGVTYHRPCVLSHATAAPSSLTTGPLVALDQELVTFNSKSLDTSQIFAVCYSDDNYASNVYDSGLRFTISKIQDLVLHTTDSPARSNTPEFLPTNRFPQWMTRQLQYVGSSDLLGKYVSLVQDNSNPGHNPANEAGIDGTGNPCVTWSGASAPASTSASGPVQLSASRTCHTSDEFRFTMTNTGGVTSAPYNVSWGMVVADWETCRDACEADPTCASVTFHKRNRQCYTSTLLNRAEDLYTHPDGMADDKSAWVSAECNSGSAMDTAMIPQANGTAPMYLERNRIYALCYSEFSSDTVSVSAGGSGDIWMDSYVRFEMTPLGFLEISGTKHWTTGSVPITGEKVAFDNFDTQRNHEFIYHGQTPPFSIRLIDATKNDNYPCTYGIHAVAHNSGSTTESDIGVARATVEQLLTTKDLNTSATYAVCVWQSQFGHDVYDSGVRMTVSKVSGVLWASGHTGNASTYHDATEPRTMTPKAALTNKFPRAPNQQLTVVGSAVEGLNDAGPVYISLVATTLNAGKPCNGPTAYAAQSSTNSGPVLTANMVATIPQATLLGGTNYDMKFRVCYGTAPDSSGNWQDSFIILEMTDIVSLNIHLPSKTGLRSSSGESPDVVIPIRTLGQIPSQRADQTVQYSVTTGDPSFPSSFKMSLVDSQENSVTDSRRNGTNSRPFLNSGLVRPDPCHSLRHVDTPKTNWATWKTARGNQTAAHGSGNASTGFVTNLDTTILSPTQLYALCYSRDGQVFFDSGIRITLPQVQGLQQVDMQGRPDRSKEITSVTKSYNVLPLDSMVGLKYVGTHTQKYFSFVEHTANNNNPCVNHDVFNSIVNSDNLKVLADLPSLQSDTVYAVCYGASITSTEMVNAPHFNWIRQGQATSNAGQSVDLSWRDSYIRVLATQVTKIRAYNVDINTRGQIPGHPVLYIQAHGLTAGQLVLVNERQNALTVGGTEHPFPCSAEFGANNFELTASSGLSACMATRNCSISPMSSSALDFFSVDTTNLDTQNVYAVCVKGGLSWRDSGIRVTVPEIQQLTLPSRQPGTPPRVLKSWDTFMSSGSGTIYDRPTSRLPNVQNVTLNFHRHSSTPGPRAAGASFAIVKVDESVLSNPCTESDGVTHGVEIDLSQTSHCTATHCRRTGALSSVGTEFVVPQGETGQAGDKLLLRLSGDFENATYTVCYRASDSNSGSLIGTMNDHPDSHTTTASLTANTVFWEDTYVRLKISALESLSASGVTHYTTGQIPNTNAETTVWGVLSGSQSAYPFHFTYGGELPDNSCVALIDEAELAQGNGEGLPCSQVSAVQAASRGVTGCAAASSSSVTEWDTTTLNTSKVYAVCYSDFHSNGVNSLANFPASGWADSGIRVTVPAIHSVLYSSGLNGPSNKEDTRARPMTATTLATNTIPIKSHVQLEYQGTLPVGKYMTLVRVQESSTLNPCVIPSSQQGDNTSPDNQAVRVPPAQASGRSVMIYQPWTKYLREDIFAVCYDGGSTAPTFQHSPECDCNLETDAAAHDACLLACTAAHDSNQGQVSSVTWRDSYIRLRAVDVWGIELHLGVNTGIAGRRTVSLRTAGGIPATSSSQRQVAFELMTSENTTDRRIRLVWEEAATATADNTGMTHMLPCNASLHENHNVSTATMSKVGIGVAPGYKITDLDTADLDTTKRFAVCYATDNGANWDSWKDSGLRVTVSKVQSVSYLGDIPWSKLSTERSLLENRNRMWTSSKTALNRIPRAPGIMLRWDHVNSTWHNERTEKPASQMLPEGSYLSIVLGSLNNNHPCADPADAAALPSAGGNTDMRSYSGPMQGTFQNNTGSGTWVKVPQGSGNLLSPSMEYAVCYASGDGTTSDITWRDSFIRIETSSVTSLSQAVQSESLDYPSFGHALKTTGQLANARALNLTVAGPPSANSSRHFRLVNASLNPLSPDDTPAVPFPCSEAAVVNDTDDTGIISTSSNTFVVDTTSLHRVDASGVETVYAVCYKDASASFWHDSALRLTLTELSEILIRSGYDRGMQHATVLPPGTNTPTPVADSGYVDVSVGQHDYSWGIDTKLDTKARHIDSQYSEKNRLISGTETQFQKFSYVTVEHSRIGQAAGDGLQVALVPASKGESWASPCDQDSNIVMQGSSGAITGTSDSLTYATRAKIIGYSGPYTGNVIEKFAVCYSLDASSGSWRDSYIRVKFSELWTVTTLGVATRTYGQVPSLLAQDELEFTINGGLAGGLATNISEISLVDETQNSHQPCESSFAATQISHPESTSLREYSGPHVVHQYVARRLSTARLHAPQPYAVCYTTGSGWIDSGIRLTVSEISSVTLPFDLTGNDGCRAAGRTCTTPDRLMTAFPEPTNRLANFDNQLLTYASPAHLSFSSSATFSIVDSSLNNNNPCVDPSIPGGAFDKDHASPGVGGSGLTGENLRQKTVQATAVANKFTVRQSDTNLLKSQLTDGTLGQEYTVCYSTGDGSNTDLSWRDSYIRLKISDMLNFGTKSVVHYTYGQVPHHPLTASTGVGLEYTFGFDTNSRLALNPSETFVSLVATDTPWLQAQVFLNWVGPREIEFTTFVGQTPTAAALVSGNLIRVGEWTHTIVETHTGGQRAFVSEEFHVNARAAAQTFWYKTNTGRQTAAGFANKPYDPCTLSGAPLSTFNETTSMTYVRRAAPNGTITNGTISNMKFHSLNVLDTTSMKAKVPYAVCYTSGNTSAGMDWVDSGIRLEVSQLTALEYSGYKRGVIGYPTAYNLGYEEVGVGDCTGSGLQEFYYFDAKFGDTECKAKCNAYADCLGYQASTTEVQHYANAKNCKIWKGVNSLSAITSATTPWGNSRCMRKTGGSDEITRGKNHRKIESRVLELQDPGSIAATVLPYGPMDLVYAGSLPASSFISLVAISTPSHPDVDTTAANPCSDAYNPATASSASSGPLQACSSPGPGYTSTVPGAQHALPGGLCRPSGTVCADKHATIMATLHAAGCPNKNKNFVSSTLMAQLESDYASNNFTRITNICVTSAGSSWGLPEAQSACCGQDEFGIALQCRHSLTCSSPTAWADCRSDVSQQENKEVFYGMSVQLQHDPTYTVCYSDGDGTATDVSWRDSFIRVSLSAITSIAAAGVTHTDHGIVPSHDSQVKLRMNYDRMQGPSPGYEIALVWEQLNSNNPCPSHTSGAANSNLRVTSPGGDSDGLIEIQTSHLDSSKTFAVCYNLTSWRDTGIRLGVTTLTNLRYNAVQQSSHVGQYTKDMTAGRVRISPADDYFVDELAGYAVTAAYEDIRDTTATHTIPQPLISSGNTFFEYVGDLTASKMVSFVEISENFGDPCVKGSVANAGPDSRHTSSTTAILVDSKNQFNISNSALRLLDPTKIYTLCYDSNGASLNQNPRDQNAVYHHRTGIEPPATGWRDSYIRVSISRIEYISSHQIEHRTQGYIANAGNDQSSSYHLTLSGNLGSAGVMHVALQDETTNAYHPCQAVAQTPSTNSSGPYAATTYAPHANSTDQRVIAVDTTGLDTSKNFAICYKSDNVWYDTGIRVWVSKVQMAHYNMEQSTELARNVYLRTFYPTNDANVSSNAYPPAINRLPIAGTGGSTFQMAVTAAQHGVLSNELVNLSYSFVDAALGVCADNAVAGASSDARRLLVAASVGSVDKDAEIAVNTTLHLAATVDQIALCYFDTNAQWGAAGQWRDTLIRFLPSKVHKLVSYNIEHATVGMVARKQQLQVHTEGSLGANTWLGIQDSAHNSNQPCGGSATFVAAADSGSNSYQLDTDGANQGTEYAVCYGEGPNNASISWFDSGIRLTVASAMTAITYSAPGRTISASTCFTSNLWGAANCNVDAVCSGNNCTGGDPSALCGSSPNQCTLIPRASSTTPEFTISGHSSAGSLTDQITYVSFVHQNIANASQAFNPCRDAHKAASSPITNLPDQRHTSGPLAVSGRSFTLPQISDQAAHSNLLAEDATFAVCYSFGNGDAADPSWRDSYVRVTMSKIGYLQARDMVIKTHGVIANARSLRVSWSGSLGYGKLLNLVQSTPNTGTQLPCNKAHAESHGEQCSEGCFFETSYAFGQVSAISATACKASCELTSSCDAWSFSATSNNCHHFNATSAIAAPKSQQQVGWSSGVLEARFEQTGWLKADAAAEFVDFDTSALTANTYYTVCYGDGTGPSDVWKDSGIKLRFIKWTNPELNRLASGSASQLSFKMNHGILSDSLDYFALIKNGEDCAAAPSTALLSNGSMARRQISTNDDGTLGFAMPSGTGASYRATGWRQCRPVLLGPTRLDMNNFETCDEPGVYQDENLEEGRYGICFCHHINGNGGCNDADEWTIIGTVNLMTTPRLGRASESFNANSHIGSVRAISQKSQTYNIKASAATGLEVSNGDKVFFKAAACDTIPSTNTASTTAPIDVTGYDDDPLSAAYAAGRVTTPSDVPLESNGDGTPKSLVSCFATTEAVTRPGGAQPRDYVKLADGLEVTAKPRLGTNMHADPAGVIRALSSSSPIFEASTFRAGDKLFFKEMTTLNWELTGFLEVGINVCDYANGETCACSNAGVLSCSNAAHTCAGFSCTNEVVSGADTDCTLSIADDHGALTHRIPGSNSASETALISGLTFFDSGPTGQTVNYVVTITNDLVYALNGESQKFLTVSTGNTYVFNLNSRVNGLSTNPLLLSASEGGEHNLGDVYLTGMTFTLDGQARTYLDYIKYFTTATTRSITFTPTVAVHLFYYSSSQVDIGGEMVVKRDDSGTFQLPTNTPLTSTSATKPRFLSACFIPAGAVETLHASKANSTCSYTSPHDSTCESWLMNSQRLEDYVQILPEPTNNLKTSHNVSEVYTLKFNKPEYGTFWRTSNHWCSGNTYLQPCGVRMSDRGLAGTSSLCCQGPPNYAAASPGDVVVFKKEDGPGAGDCTGVESITDSDYFIGATYTRKMRLSTIDDDRSSQTSPERADLSIGSLRSASEKGAEVSPQEIAKSKVNELPEGSYTICFATAESGANENADFVKLSKSLQIVPPTSAGRSIEIPRTVLNGHFINVKWSSSNEYQSQPTEANSWIGLFRVVNGVGECPNGSGPLQNKCYIASRDVAGGVTGTGTVSFSQDDYNMVAGEYEVRYFEGNSRDGHGVVCRGMREVASDSVLNCVLESVVTSSPIIVYSNIQNMDENTALPGLEMVFEGDNPRYTGGLSGGLRVENVY